MADDKFDPMEMEEDSSFDFTIAEILEMESLFKKLKQESICEEFCRELTAKFNCSSHRSEKPPLKWEKVQSYFQSKREKVEAKVIPSPVARRPVASSKALVIKKRAKEPTMSADEAFMELSDLNFEAKSAKDHAWFDVASFLNYRVLYSGELEVRVRFAGFGNEEDEWVNVKYAIRDRSIPLDPSECDRVNVGDLVLCYREAEDHALYTDAHVMEIERHFHDGSGCTCVFLVRYDYDNFEEKVLLANICCRPTQSESRGTLEIEACRLPELEYNCGGDSYSIHMGQPA